MKKRILALALAGTTAFSVFGAVSVNAATVSADVAFEVDAYVSYTPVTQTITVDVETSTPVADAYLYNNGTGWIRYENATTLSAALKNDKRIQTNYTDLTITHVDSKSQVHYVTDDLSTFVIEVSGKYHKYPLNASYLTSNFGINKLTTGQYTVNGITKEGSADLKPFDTLSAAIEALKNLNKDTDAVKAEPATLYAFTPTLTATLETQIITATDVYNSDVAFTAAAKYVNEAAIMADPACVLSQSQPDHVDGNDDIDVSHKQLNNNDVWVFNQNTNDWTDWTFNSDMSGEASVYPFTVESRLVTDPDTGIIYLDSYKTEAPTIYAYDFLYGNVAIQNQADDIATAWNNDNLTATAALLGDTNGGAYTAEEGRGVIGRGIRYDVVTEWVDFLEELAINHDNGYRETLAEFISNYSDMIYLDPEFNPFTGLVNDYDRVDLYNITGLLTDIYELSARYANNTLGIDGWDQANTSEMVYLMQQYDKYIGDYINKTEITSDDWGDLLLSLLDAATESDFRSASEYRKYQNEVEDLRDAYEMATTVNMIRAVESGMYDLLVSANNRYRASTNADTAALGTTLEGLYFNVGAAPAEYMTAPSTHSNNVDYSNYDYYVAAVVGGSWVSGNQNLVFGSSLSRGFYSLYPALDYNQSGNTAMQYPGNAGRASTATTYGVTTTDEYEWFLNVYELAVNMNSDNTKQGSVDAVNDALAAAVADLAVTTSPNALERGAVEDAMTEYEGKIESDYNAGYYAKYTQAYDYAENDAEGLWQTRIAAMIVGVSGEALTYQGTQVTVTKNDMKTLETAISNGQAALEAIRNSEDYNAAQVNALNRAIDTAQHIVDLYEGVASNSTASQSVNHIWTHLVGDKDQFVMSDVTAAIEAIDAAINYSEIVMGWSKNEAGKWMYGTEEGYLANGWNQVDGGKTWFYFNEDGTAKQSEWFQENGTWYWFNSNCGAATGWAKVDGEWYFFKGNNAMKTGWEKVDGNWYYMASSGKMVTGWCEIGGKWYYFSKESNSLGQMLYSTTVDGYKLDANGVWVK